MWKCTERVVEGSILNYGKWNVIGSPGKMVFVLTLVYPLNFILGGSRLHFHNERKMDEINSQRK